MSIPTNPMPQSMGAIDRLNPPLPNYGAPASYTPITTVAPLGVGPIAVANRFVYTYGMLLPRCTLTSFYIQVTTASSTDARYRVAMYSGNPVNQGMPYQNLVEVTIDASVVGMRQTLLTTPINLDPGWYYPAIKLERVAMDNQPVTTQAILNCLIPAGISGWSTCRFIRIQRVVNDPTYASGFADGPLPQTVNYPYSNTTDPNTTANIWVTSFCPVILPVLQGLGV